MEGGAVILDPTISPRIIDYNVEAGDPRERQYPLECSGYSCKIKLLEPFHTSFSVAHTRNCVASERPAKYLPRTINPVYKLVEIKCLQIYQTPRSTIKHNGVKKNFLGPFTKEEHASTYPLDIDVPLLQYFDKMLYLKSARIFGSLARPTHFSHSPGTLNTLLGSDDRKCWLLVLDVSLPSHIAGRCDSICMPSSTS